MCQIVEGHNTTTYLVKVGGPRPQWPPWFCHPCPLLKIDGCKCTLSTCAALAHANFQIFSPLPPLARSCPSFPPPSEVTQLMDDPNLICLIFIQRFPTGPYYQTFNNKTWCLLQITVQISPFFKRHSFKIRQILENLGKTKSFNVF